MLVVRCAPYRRCSGSRRSCPVTWCTTAALSSLPKRQALGPFLGDSACSGWPTAGSPDLRPRSAGARRAASRDPGRHNAEQRARVSPPRPESYVARPPLVRHGRRRPPPHRRRHHAISAGSEADPTADGPHPEVRRPLAVERLDSSRVARACSRVGRHRRPRPPAATAYGSSPMTCKRRRSAVASARRRTLSRW